MQPSADGTVAQHRPICETASLASLVSSLLGPTAAVAASAGGVAAGPQQDSAQRFQNFDLSDDPNTTRRLGPKQVTAAQADRDRRVVAKGQYDDGLLAAIAANPLDRIGTINRYRAATRLMSTASPVPQQVATVARATVTPPPPPPGVAPSSLSSSGGGGSLVVRSSLVPFQPNRAMTAQQRTQAASNNAISTLFVASAVAARPDMTRAEPTVINDGAFDRLKRPRDDGDSSGAGGGGSATYLAGLSVLSETDGRFLRQRYLHSDEDRSLIDGGGERTVLPTDTATL